MGLKVHGLDDLDLQILDILIKDSRIPFLEIARTCHVSGGTIHVRMKKMEDMGIIKGTKLIIDNSKLGYDVCCFIGIYLDKAKSFNEALEQLQLVKEIVELHYTTGEYSIFVKVVCRNIADLQNLLMNKIQSIDGIQRTDTFISLFQPIDRNIDINILDT
ncbi:Lrp/AsnC ligand binding domain-containing protein [Clostridium sp. CX1]|uniref:Lrp/AsnC ligand binding domain-containing protein n=1 Tax=Clostridium tanneri TaxID=3037988 RepID=A0ABU4JVA9_9CLOT|nr:MULTISPECIES: Lrp/AsnC ligand binding domain-containing protein [unclassified Clostridium]MCT8977978.1 Lrp/AsnC ligand binding domain-containing protein [Clostridium sp. CX1]MDW8802068.1 Lrp/AsnC ligand binding domain-containing protein [Clostridium sp. A1-XYC3]